MKQRLFPACILLFAAVLLPLFGCSQEEPAAPAFVVSGGMGTNGSLSFAAEEEPLYTPGADAARTADSDVSSLQAYWQSAPDVSQSDAVEIALYASLPFGEGSLVLAERLPEDEDAAPNLCYITAGKVLAATRDADAHSLNLARLYGHTVLYGPAAGEGVTSVSASFFNGETVSAPVVPGRTEPVFLLCTEGCTDLAAITFFNGSEPVADETDARFALHDPGLTKDTPAEIFSRVRLTALSAGFVEEPHAEVCIPGNAMDLYDWEFTRYAKNRLEWTPSDAWRNNNALWQRFEAKGGSTARIVNLPDEVLKAYLVPTALDTGNDMQQHLIPLTLSGEKITFPTVAGQTAYQLCIELDDAVYALPVVLTP